MTRKVRIWCDSLKRGIDHAILVNFLILHSSYLALKVPLAINRLYLSRLIGDSESVY